MVYKVVPSDPNDSVVTYVVIIYVMFSFLFKKETNFHTECSSSCVAKTDGLTSRWWFLSR